jgi:UDP-N-acetylglucosamine:LPS N-acetylglucosamine transferase
MPASFAAPGTGQHTGPPRPAAGPQRVLIISANIGEGHNSAGRAIEESIRRVWPACSVRWLDTLAVMGPGIGPMARAWYIMEVQQTPWMYDFFFAALWRHRWFLDWSRRLMGTWCGRGMARAIRSYDPDLIISTYPLGSAGLSWLRRFRGLATPVGAFVSDFCPHPFWVYGDLDITYVMHPGAAAVAQRVEPGARVVTGGLLAGDAFRPADRTDARAGLGLDPSRFVAVLSAGSFGFGRVDRAVAAMLAAGPGIQAVVICGRNEQLRRRLTALGEPAGRLAVVGWTDEMSRWVSASDVVITNAGGVTALEAVASSRPVIMYEPIAGHGRANADLMAKSGLALLCPGPAELTAALRRLAGEPALRAALEEAALSRASSRRRDDDLRDLWAVPSGQHALALPVRAEDALFLDAQRPNVTQQVGAVVMLAGGPVSLADLQAGVAYRVEQIPQLRRRLVPSVGPWDRPRWLVEEHIDACSRISEVALGRDGAPGSLDELVGQFFSAPLDPAATPWEMLLVRGIPDGTPGSSAIVVKVHHALGDSYALISALSGLFDPAGGRPAGQLLADAAGGSRLVGHPARAGRDRVLSTMRCGQRVVSGLCGMAWAGHAPPTSVNGPLTRPGRRFVHTRLPARAVAVTARRLGASPADLVLALVADGLGRLLAGRGELTDGRKIRVLVPHTARLPGRGGTAGSLRRHAAGPAPGLRPGRTRPRRLRAMARSRRHPPAARHERPAATAPGNRTAGVLLDLPVGPMPLAERVAAVKRLHAARLRRGDAEATAFVLSAMNLLPEPARRAFARAVYTSGRFNLIVSVFPGVRRQCRLLGAEITEVYPVLALASGVGLTIGAMTWGQSLSVGILADEALVPDVGVLAAGIRGAFDSSQAESAGEQATPATG